MKNRSSSKKGKKKGKRHGKGGAKASSAPPPAPAPARKLTLEEQYELDWDLGLKPDATVQERVAFLSQQQAYAGMAQKHYEEGEYGGCRAMCQLLYNMNPRHVNNLTMMSAVHFQLRMFTESIKYSKAVININPNLAAVRLTWHTVACIARPKSVLTACAPLHCMYVCGM